MNSPIEKYFQIGTIQWMSHPPTDYELVSSIKTLASDAYFSALEITHIGDDDTRTKVKRLLAQSHMKVCFGAQPILLSGKLNPNAINEEERVLAETALINAVDEAEYLGAQGIAFLSGKWEEATKDEAYHALVKTTRNVCSYAKTKNMYVELEVFDFDMDKASLIGPAPLAAQFAADVRTTHNNFGLMVDLSHFPTTYETSKFVVETCRPYITHFHIGNAVVKEGYEAFGDMHPRFGFPDSANDTAELVDFFKVLKDEGFFNKENPYVLSFEVKPWGDEDGDIIVANTKRVIKRAWALLED
jgi:sugar phosphate isomerase/epimerase